MRGPRAAAAGLLLLVAGGCLPAYVVPDSLDRQVDRSVSFSQLKGDAARYTGASVVLGGEVLNARIFPEGTEIEVLQLPLDASDRPVGDYGYSEGRFLVIDPERRDPIVLRRRLITVVGEVLGTKVQQIDEAEYAYPYLSSRFIRVWRGPSDYPADAVYPYSYPYPYTYPYAYPYSYPYGFYYYPYYYDPFFWSGSFYYYDYHDHYGRPRGGPAQRRFEPPAPRGGTPPSDSGGGGVGGGGGGRRFK